MIAPLLVLIKLVIIATPSGVESKRIYMSKEKKYGLIFFIRAIIFHYLYIFCIAGAGLLGLEVGKLSKKEKYEL